MVYYFFLCGGSNHTHQKIPETFQPELRLCRDGVNAAGEEAPVVGKEDLRRIHLVK